MRRNEPGSFCEVRVDDVAEQRAAAVFLPTLGPLEPARLGPLEPGAQRRPFVVSPGETLGETVPAADSLKLHNETVNKKIRDTAPRLESEW